MRIKKSRDIGRVKTDQIFELADAAFRQLEDSPKKALSTIRKAWALHPGDKFQWGTARMIAHWYVQILNFNRKHKEALALITQEIEHEMNDEEAGYQIVSSAPWIDAAETALFLGQVELAKDHLDSAYYLDKERGFRDHPPLYLKIATARRLDRRSVIKQFKELDVNQRLLDHLNKHRQEDASRTIQRLCEEGNALLEKRRFAQAIATWKKALAMIDEPTVTSTEATWLHGSIGEAYYLKRDFKNALAHFRTASKTADGATNPFLLMRAGQSLFEVNHGFTRSGKVTARQEKEATELLLKAYMLKGRKIFDDRRHLVFLQSTVKLK